MHFWFAILDEQGQVENTFCAIKTAAVHTSDNGKICKSGSHFIYEWKPGAMTKAMLHCVTADLAETFYTFGLIAPLNDI